MFFAFVSFLGVIALVIIKYRKSGGHLDAPPESIPLTSVTNSKVSAA